MCFSEEIDQRRETSSIGPIFATISEWPTNQDLAVRRGGRPELLTKRAVLFELHLQREVKVSAPVLVYVSRKERA
jgi:hypothetical protein